MSGNDAILRELELIKGMLGAMGSHLMTAEETAKYLGITLGTLYTWTSKSEIPHFKRAKLLYFDKAQLDAWVKSHPVRSKEQVREQLEQEDGDGSS